MLRPEWCGAAIVWKKVSTNAMEEFRSALQGIRSSRRMSVMSCTASSKKTMQQYGFQEAASPNANCADRMTSSTMALDHQAMSEFRIWSAPR